MRQQIKMWTAEASVCYYCYQIFIAHRCSGKVMFSVVSVCMFTVVPMWPLFMTPFLSYGSCFNPLPTPTPLLSPHREPDMSKLVHYVVQTVSKWAVGIGLKCLLVVLNCVKDPKLMFLVWSASTLGILDLIVHAVPKGLGRVRWPKCYEIKVTELKIWNPLLSHISKNVYSVHNIDKIRANWWIKVVALGTSHLSVQFLSFSCTFRQN